MAEQIDIPDKQIEFYAYDSMPTLDILKSENFWQEPEDFQQLFLFDDMSILFDHEYKQYLNILKDIFLVRRRHQNVNCLCCLQSIFQKDPIMKDLIRNASGIIILEDVYGQSLLHSLQHKIYTGYPKFLILATKMAFSEGKKYIYLDSSVQVPFEYRLRSGLFSGEEAEIFKPVLNENV